MHVRRTCHKRCMGEKLYLLKTWMHSQLIVAKVSVTQLLLVLNNCKTFSETDGNGREKLIHLSFSN